MPETWTIKKLLDWTQGFFQTKNIPSARLDAELLLSRVLGLSRIELYLKFDRPVLADELQAFKKLITRRAELEPVAYILGEKEFYSRRFAVTPDVLIPRPDSEVLIEKTLALLQNRPESDLQGLEVGLGSGCLSVTLLCENLKIRITACDISEKALQVGVQNATQHSVGDRLHAFAADWLTSHHTDPRLLNLSLDFLIANPPYISDAEFATLAPNVKAFEPTLALKGGVDGLNFYPTLAQFAKAHIKPDGFAIVEIGETQGQAVCEIFKNAGFSRVLGLPDYAGLDRCVLAFL